MLIAYIFQTFKKNPHGNFVYIITVMKVNTVAFHHIHISSKYDNMEIVIATIHNVFKLAKSETSTTKW